MGYNRYDDGRSSSRYGGSDRSKRQARVGHVVRSQLASIIQVGTAVKNPDGRLDDDLRRRISVVNADVSPDLRQARVTISVIGRRDGTGTEEVDKRRAYSWLVRNTKPIRHAMAQRISHMKTCPDLSFVRADVGAAVDVMHLIEKVGEGYKRDSVGAFGGDDNSMPWGSAEWAEQGGAEESDDDGWVDFDDDEDDDEDDDDDEDEDDEDVDKDLD